MDALPIVDVVTGDTAMVLQGQPLLAAGTIGNAVFFDSTLVTIDQVISLSDDRFTLMTWFYDNSPGGFGNFSSSNLFHQRYDGTYIFPFMLPFGVRISNSFYYQLPLNVSPLASMNHAVFFPGWKHMALCIDTVSGTGKMYTNGLLTSTFHFGDSVNFSALTNTMPAFFGGDSITIFGNLTYHYGLGMIDDFRYYDDTLSQSEIQALVGDFCGWSITFTHDFVPGVKATANLSFLNYSTTDQSGTQWLYWPHDSVIITPSTPPDTIINDTLFWHVNNIAPLGFSNITFTTYTDTNVVVGSQYPMAYGFFPNSACPGSGPITQTVYTDIVTVQGSYDPNDKQVNYPDALPGEWLTYTVRFQNTGTAAANRVIIRDTLSTELDFSTLQVTGTSHDMYPVLDPATRSVAFVYNPIVLPDSGADLAGSQGFVQYRVQIANGFALADTIRNHASIYFDFNPPIVTNTTFTPYRTATSLVEHLVASEFRLWPNPAGTVLNVRCTDATQLRVLDMQGRVLITEQASTSTVLDITTLPVGVYTLLADTPTGPQARRFVVNR